MGEIIMPTELAAENGAKYAFIGEFHETINVACPECYDDDDEDCELCGGHGSIPQKVDISWTNIKAIYEKAVKMFGQTI